MCRFVLFFLVFTSCLHAQPLPPYKPSDANLQQAYVEGDKLWREWAIRAIKLDVNPNWIGKSGLFWYRNDLYDGEREFIFVDPRAGERRAAFDRNILAEAVKKAGGPKIDPKKLPFDSIEFRDGNKKIAFRLDKDQWIFDIENLSAFKETPTAKQKVSLPTLRDEESSEVIEEGFAMAPQVGSPRQTTKETRVVRVPSPDGKLAVIQRNYNLFLNAGNSNEIALTKDGVEKNYYDMVIWSPDSKKIVAHRVVPHPTMPVYLLESSPPGGGRAKLHTRDCVLPGDPFSEYESWIFDVATKTRQKVETEKLDFGFPKITWCRDGTRYRYPKTDRGHQRYRVVEVDTKTCKSRAVYEDQSKTFINQYTNFTAWFLNQTDELIVSSERDGWNHFYLVDLMAGKIKNQITKGEFVVQSCDRVDVAKRKILLRVCGLYKDQDPYFAHYCQVNFDGTGFTPLTVGNGTHSLKWSPDRSFYIDTWSRVDEPPVHELRNGADGQFICVLETADITRLKKSKWKTPEVFVAKGRDGKTDIWGMVSRPTHFDPQKKYPIIEYIYAAPHGSFVDKAFKVAYGREALAELGFIVVQCDGMGTLNRSKAFHDVCWKNVGDAGFPDRIAWIKALAAKYPQVDATRVGIYGTSSGGQNSTGALLFHGDFYKVAVSSCGCHDNRMDKYYWNEQWMGYPVGPHYEAQSNITNAKHLKGKLMLIVGELDTNVPPESTYRLADALLKANKDFDMVMVPGMDHSDGGGPVERRRRDFFVRHLLGVQTPDWNAIEK